MIYLYIQIFIVYMAFIYICHKFKEKMPESIRKNLRAVQAVTLVVALLIAGSPVRLESTSLSGKESFTSTPEYTERVTGSANPATTNLQAELEKLQQQSEEVQNEIND